MLAAVVPALTAGAALAADAPAPTATASATSSTSYVDEVAMRIPEVKGNTRIPKSPLM